MSKKSSGHLFRKTSLFCDFFERDTAAYRHHARYIEVGDGLQTHAIVVLPRVS